MLLTVLLFSSLIAGGLLTWIGIAQLLFWAYAVFSKTTGATVKIAKLSAAFLLLNIAAVLAWFLWISGVREVWKKESIQ